MIPQINEINFPSYATLSNATVSLAEMGDRFIQTQVKIDGEIVPSFDGWELSFRGERFVLDIKDPQASKDNTSLNSIVDLTFHSWPTVQLKRYFMFTTPPSATGFITADKYATSVALNLNNFCALLNQVLEYYYGADIYVDLNPNVTYESTPALFDINYTHIWDVIIKIYEIYGVRWRIEHVTSPAPAYVIKIGYDAPEIADHVFEYGYRGGLMKFERQVQNPDIANILLGRGGEKNLPYRYFKLRDAAPNDGWAPDPDAIPELANIYFDRLRDAAFRWYVRGWMTNDDHRDHSWDSTHTYPTYEIGVDHPFYWAYHKGATDEAFDPVEYVKDDVSIAKYGEKWGHVDDNDDIYPTIQGVKPDDRFDTVLSVSPISDDAEETAAASANIVDLSYGKTTQTNAIEPTTSDLDLQREEIWGDHFTVPTGMTANLLHNEPFVTADENRATLARLSVVTNESRVAVYRASDDVEVPSSGLAAGEYYYVLYIALRNTNSTAVENATYGYNGLRLEQTAAGTSDGWKPTFDIWVRNLFNSAQGTGETDDDYAFRIWGEILGDRLGNEAAVVFSDGFMSISEDYTFKIASYPVVDRSKTFTTAGGQVMTSEWRITLYKSDAELNATGIYIPNTQYGGAPVAGDHFFFIGIDMPNMYVTLAEEQVTNSKIPYLYENSEITPTWVVSLDNVRMDDEYNSEQERLFDKIEAGAKMYFYDPRFTDGRTLELFAQTVTFTWSEDTVVLPHTEIVLTDKVYVSSNVIASLQGDVNNLRSSIAQMSDVSHVIKESVKPLFLSKTGEEDTSLSPTKFASLVTSEDFKQGGFGGKGWGFYRDNTMAYQDLQQVVATRRAMLRDAATQDGNSIAAVPSVHAGNQSVLEVDRLIVRRDMQVNNLVINQIAYVGGKQIISAAAMECTQVVENDDSYDCYFDQKQGTVKNLFQVNDVAMGQVFTAENTQLRFYKRKVIKVGLDYIRLSKSIANGSGVPKKGDVIVQFGNYVDEDRRFAIVRDVIGGGYEQMLSDLDNVNSSGVEYYFAGLNAHENSGADTIPLMTSQDENLRTSQSEDLHVLDQARPRFFVGDPDSKMEFSARDKTLRVKGVISQSPSGIEFPIVTFRNDGNYSPDKWYYYGDLVMYNGEGWVHIGKTATKGTAPSTGNVWTLYTAKGESYYRIDLTNENATINANSGGQILPGAARPDCTATMYYGTGVVSGVTYALGIPSGQNVQGVSINSSTGLLTFNAGSAATPFSFDGNSLQLTVIGSLAVSGQMVNAQARMNIVKNIPGAQGESATSYWLVLDSDKVAVDPNDNNSISPTTVTPSAMLQVGEEAPRSAVAADNLSITYNYDSETEAALPAAGFVTIALLNASSQKRKTLHFHLYKTTNNVATEVDQESVPILYEGKDGRAAVRLDSDNEMDVVPTDSTGRVSAARTVTAHFTLYDGTSVGTSATLASTAASLAIGGVTPSLSISNGVVTASWAFTTSNTLSATGTVTIVVAYGGINYSAQFSIAPSMGQPIYQLKPSMSSIPFSRDANGDLTPASQNVGLSVVKLDGASTAEYTTFPVTGVTVRYSTSSMPSSASGGDAWPATSPYQVSVPNTATSLFIAMFNSSGTLLDRETIPVIKDGQKGSQGLQGKIMRGVNLFSSVGVGGDSSVPYEGLEDPYSAAHPFYDMVYTVNSQTQAKTYYYCKVGGADAASNGPGTPGGSDYWVQANQFDFVATRVLLAQNAHIDFLDGQRVLVMDGNTVVAGMIGGTGTNFFAGSNEAGADSAPFHVDNAGNLYASNAQIGGKIIASGTQTIPGSTDTSALASLNGLYVASGGARVAAGNVTIADGNFTILAGAQHNMTAASGNNQGKVQIDGASGTVTIEVTGNAQVKRGSGNAENIITSPTIKHIVECENGQVPQPGDSNYDAYTLYLEKRATT